MHRLLAPSPVTAESRDVKTAPYNIRQERLALRAMGTDRSVLGDASAQRDHFGLPWARADFHVSRERAVAAGGIYYGQRADSPRPRVFNVRFLNSIPVAFPRARHPSRGGPDAPCWPAPPAPEMSSEPRWPV